MSSGDSMNVTHTDDDVDFSNITDSEADHENVVTSFGFSAGKA